MLTPVALLLAATMAPLQAAPWSINPNNTLMWEGDAYLPVGVRVPGQPDAIKLALAAGVTELIVEMPANGVGWDEAITVLNSAGARWFLAVSSAAPPALGTVVEPQGYRVDITGQLDVDLALPGSEQVLAVVVDKRSSFIRSYGIHETQRGILSERFDSKVELPHVILLYPIVRDLSTPDFWDGFDAHRDTLLTSLRDHDLGAGFRGVIDPLGSVANFPTPNIRFVPRSPIFAIEMEAFLKEKYGTVQTCIRSWSIGAHDIETFEQLARLVPLWSETKGVESLWDPVKDRLYPSDRNRSTVWTDIRRVIRSAAVNRYGRLVQSIARIKEVPVIQTWSGWTGPYDSPMTGVSGIGLESNAKSINNVIEDASRPLSAVLHGGFNQVLMATALTLDSNSQLTVDDAVLELKGMGTRGWFFRTTDPTQLADIVALNKTYRQDSSDSQWKPRALLYPEGARDPAIPARILGGTWMLPSPAAGNRLELGSALSGYYYGGFPSPYTVIWARSEPIKTKIFLANPEDVSIEALDGSEVIYRSRKDHIEIEIPTVPLIFSGIEDVPVPEVSFQEMALMTSALFSNFSTVVDPSGDQEFQFAQNATSFKRNPIGAFSALTRQYNVMLPRAAPYYWIEAELSRDSNFSEPKYVPGASASNGLVLDTRLASPTGGYYVNYKVNPRIPGDHEIWLAADIPESLLESITIRVGLEVRKFEGRPTSFYGLNLAWYNFGHVEIDEASDVVIEIATESGARVILDVLVLSPITFVPDGPRKPNDFLNPGQGGTD